MTTSNFNIFQVIDLCDMHPENALEWCHLLPDVLFRVLVCGGDGSVGWVLNAIENLKLKVNTCSPRPSCPKLTTSLVNKTLNLQMYCMQKYCLYLQERYEELLMCKSFSHFLSKKINVSTLGFFFFFLRTGRLHKPLTNDSDMSKSKLS